MDQDKRRYRKLKRDVKRAGNRARRRHLKRELTEGTASTSDTDFDYGRKSSASLNGHDRDATRRRPRDEEE